MPKGSQARVRWVLALLLGVLLCYTLTGGTGQPAAEEDEPSRVERTGPPDPETAVGQKARALRGLAQKLREELEANGTNLLSVKSLEMVEEIEEAAKELKEEIRRR